MADNVVVTLPSYLAPERRTRVRQLIESETTWYVSNVDGADTNDGESPATAFRSIQGGTDKLRARYDFAAVPTLQVLTTGVVYNESVNLGKWVGSAEYFRIAGDVNNNAAVAVAPSVGPAFKCVGGRGSPYLLDSMLYQSTDYSVISDAGSHLLLQNPNFSWCSLAHMFAEHMGFLEILRGPYTISGGALWHIAAVANGEFIYQGNTISFANNPIFNMAFVLAAHGGLAYCRELSGWSGDCQIQIKTAIDGGRIIPPSGNAWPP